MSRPTPEEESCGLQALAALPERVDVRGELHALKFYPSAIEAAFYVVVAN